MTTLTNAAPNGLATMKLTEITKLPGVGDLPLKVRGKFAQALRAEATGDHGAAKALLDEAVLAEESA